MDVHPSAFKHGIALADIEHAVTDELPLVIHAMELRAKYRRLLPRSEA